MRSLTRDRSDTGEEDRSLLGLEMGMTGKLAGPVGRICGAPAGGGVGRMPAGS